MTLPRRGCSRYVNTVQQTLFSEHVHVTTHCFQVKMEFQDGIITSCSCSWPSQRVLQQSLLQTIQLPAAVLRHAPNYSMLTRIPYILPCTRNHCHRYVADTCVPFIHFQPVFIVLGSAKKLRFHRTPFGVPREIHNYKVVQI